MSASPLVLIDLSSIAHPIFHMSASEPDPNWTSARIVERIRALASGQPHVAICCDSGKSFRAELDPTYKANRPESDATLRHQIALAVETLRGDGFPVWAVKGFEADDLIASAVAATADRYIVTAGMSASSPDGPHMPRGGGNQPVLIISADKDLLALVGPGVQAKSLRDGSLIDEAAVLAKFGVRPDQMRDYLSLVGDKSDNVIGAKGIGEKKAAMLLGQFGTLDKLMASGGEGLTPALRDSLVEFSSRADLVRSLVTLRTDAPVPIEEAFAPRVVQEERSMQQSEQTEQIDDAIRRSAIAQNQQQARPEIQEMPQQEARMPSMQSAAPTVALVHEVMSAPAPTEWTMQLEPRCMAEARQLAADMHASRLFSAYGSPAAVLSTVLAGRELGIQSMSSLRSFNIIGGKPAMSADTIRGLVQKSPLCEYFRCKSRSATSATWVTKRKGDDEPTELTYTIEQGRLAWEKDQKAWDASAWGKRPTNMVTKSASNELARLVYADVVGNMYSAEELVGEEQ